LVTNVAGEALLEYLVVILNRQIILGNIYLNVRLPYLPSL